MLKVNLKKLKAYGDRLDDGALQLSFTLPVSASPEAKEAARRYVEQLGLEKVSVATMEAMGDGFCHVVVYGHAKHTIDFAKIRVPKIDVPQMDYAELKEYMDRHLDEPLVVIGAATGADAHTVGIDAIMNMKGFGGDYGLERYPLFRAINLRSQLTNQQLIDKAVELKADAVLISQVVTQRDSHIKNLKEFRALAGKDKRLSRNVVLIIGGPRINHALALKLGFDAGYGPGTKPSQVANFIVREYIRRHGIKERPQAEVKVKAEVKAKAEVKVKAKAEVKVQQEARHPQQHSKRHQEPRGYLPPPAAEDIEDAAQHAAEADGAPKAAARHPHASAAPGAPKKRRRGRRGGRRHRRKREAAAKGTATQES